MKQIYLYPGQWAFSKDEAELSTILGSCVAVALYDYKLKMGALNHYLLPTLKPNEAESTRYGNIAMATIIDTMMKNGSDRKSLQAKIYGGASVLSGVTIGEGIGNNNVELALQTLDENRIPILEKNVGGNKGRKIYFNTSTFAVRHVLMGVDEGRVDTTGFGLVELSKKVRVVIVDDSATVRSLFQKIFEKHGIEVVGTAANPYEARELIVSVKPDVITLDLEMPRMNGVVFLEKLMKHMPMPVVVVSSLGSQGEAALKTLELGAVEFIHKPSQFDPAILRQLGEMLVEKVKAAASVNVLNALRSKQHMVKSAPAPAVKGSNVNIGHSVLKAIVIGGNAGSADSLRKILENLPADTPPVVVANATVAPFIESFINQLRRRVQVTLAVAKQGEVLKMGCVYFAPQDLQTRIISSGLVQSLDLKNDSPFCGQRPSSTLLFESAASVFGSGVIALLLGGFGFDGVDGVQKIRARGGITFVENPAEIPFPYGPQSAIAIGVVDRILNAGEIAEAINGARNARVAA
jgi:two-component system chemotaxis response regulator CheB